MIGSKELAEMAIQAGGTFSELPMIDAWVFDDVDKSLEAFAKLVAQRERERIAQMIENAPPLVDFCKNDKNGCLICGFTPSLAAQTIRELE